MGDAADMALECTQANEEWADRYVAGEMGLQEAYEHGLIDARGFEDPGVQAAWDRAGIGTREELDNKLSHARKDLALAVAGGSMHHEDDGSVDAYEAMMANPEEPDRPILSGPNSDYTCICKLSETVRETPRGTLLPFNGEHTWFPKSQCRLAYGKIYATNHIIAVKEAELANTKKWTAEARAQQQSFRDDDDLDVSHMKGAGSKCKKAKRPADYDTPETDEFGGIL